MDKAKLQDSVFKVFRIFVCLLAHSPESYSLCLKGALCVLTPLLLGSHPILMKQQEVSLAAEEGPPPPCPARPGKKRELKRVHIVSYLPFFREGRKGGRKRRKEGKNGRKENKSTKKIQPDVDIAVGELLGNNEI